MKEAPFQLTLGGFKQAALKAIEEQRLAIQHEDHIEEYEANSGMIECMNTYPPEHFGGKVCHCIIGSALPPKIASEYSEEPIDDLIRQRVVSASEADLFVLHRLQIRHDELIQGFDPHRLGPWLRERDAFIQSIRDLEVPEAVRVD